MPFTLNITDEELEAMDRIDNNEKDRQMVDIERRHCPSYEEMVQSLTVATTDKMLANWIHNLQTSVNVLTKEIRRLKADNHDMEDRIEELEGNLEKATDTIDELEEKNTELEEKLEEMSNTVDELENDVANLDDRYYEVKNDSYNTERIVNSISARNDNLSCNVARINDRLNRGTLNGLTDN